MTTRIHHPFKQNRISVLHLTLTCMCDDVGISLTSFKYVAARESGRLYRSCCFPYIYIYTHHTSDTFRCCTQSCVRLVTCDGPTCRRSAPHHLWALTPEPPYERAPHWRKKEPLDVLAWRILTPFRLNLWSVNQSSIIHHSSTCSLLSQLSQTIPNHFLIQEVSKIQRMQGFIIFHHDSSWFISTLNAGRQRHLRRAWPTPGRHPHPPVFVQGRGSIGSWL